GRVGVAVATSVFAAFGSLASPTAFIAGLRPSFTIVAALAVVGALAAFGAGGAHVVARAPESRPRRSARAFNASRLRSATEARAGTVIHTQAGRNENSICVVTGTSERVGKVTAV